MISLTLGKQRRNLQLTQRTQEAEILNFIDNILSHIIPEIALKLDGLAVLVVDVRPRHSRFIGAVFVRQGDIFRMASKGHQNADKSQQGRKRRMTIQIAFLVELQHRRVEGTVDDNKFIVLVSSRFHTIQCCSTRIDNHRDDRHFVSQTLQGDHRVLATAYGN